MPAMDLDVLFQDPDDFYLPDKQPSVAQHQLRSGHSLRVRLVGSHPLYGDLLWNAGRISADYIEERADSLIAGKDVLEIGAAAGVPSIVSAIQGARTVVMTDYPDPELVDNMRQNAVDARDLIRNPACLHVEGYKWGSTVEPLLSHLPPGAEGFDVLIMADVVYSHREHGNLIKTMQRTLKKSADSVALVIFTPYQPWLLSKTEQFFPLAEENGFSVTKVFEKIIDQALFEDDPGDETLRRTVFGYQIRWR